MFDERAQAFRFHAGPIFHSVVLADEINRAPPKTQSALLEAMEERQVSLDGQTRTLPEPFFVIATQNPVEQIGAYPLPESQLDRFLIAIELGYPDALAERELLAGGDRRAKLADIVAAVAMPRRSPNGSAKRRRSTSRPRCSTTCRRCSPHRAATAGPDGRRQRRSRRAARLEPARGPDAARRGARVGAARRPADGDARRRAGGVPRRWRAIASPAARAPARCRRRALIRAVALP